MISVNIFFLVLFFFFFLPGMCVCVVLDFKSSCVIKNRRKASNIKVLKFIDQNSALGCLSDKSLTKKQHQGNISQSIYRYCVDLCHFLVGRQNRPTSISFFVLQLLQNNMWLSPPFSFCSLINWYQTLNCYVCVWGYFSHFTLVQNVLTVCTSLSSMCL